MKTHLLPYYKILRNKVIDKFNGSEVQSSDCYLLANEIHRLTQKSISETTLKRFFGHTTSAHNPSQYTLNALSMYIGSTSWRDFIDQEDQKLYSTGDNKLWHELKSYTDKISHFNIFAAERKSLTASSCVLDRQKILSHLFTKDNESNLTIIHGASKCGKTMAAIQAIKEKIINSREDVLLYVDSMTLFHSAVYGFNPNKWFSTILDFESEAKVEQFFNSYENEAPGTCQIIFDGFNEELLNEKLFNSVIINFIDVLRFFSTYKWLKFTLIARNDIYLKIAKRIPQKNSNTFKFRVINFDHEYRFTSIEVSNLLDFEKIEHTIDELTSCLENDWLKNPAYLINYLELYQKNKKLDFRNKETYYLTIHQVYGTNTNLISLFEHFEPQQLFELINSLHCPKGLETLLKSNNFNHLNNTRVQNSSLFYELLGYGIIRRHQAEMYDGYVYSAPMLKCYLLSVYNFFYLKNRDLTSFHNFFSLNFESKALIENAIKWFYLFTLENLDFSIFKNFSNTVFQNINRNEAIYYSLIFSQNLYFQSSHAIQKEIQFLLQELHIGYILAYKCLLPVEKAQHGYDLLLTMTSTVQDQIQIKTKIAFGALLNWDEEILALQLEDLTYLSLKDPETQFSIEPVSALSAIYHFFKNGSKYQHLIDSAFKGSEKNPKLYGVREEMITFDILGYVLILISKDIKHSSQFLQIIKHKLKIIENQESRLFNFYTLLQKLLQYRLGIKTISNTRIMKSEDKTDIEEIQPSDYLMILQKIGDIHCEMHSENIDIREIECKKNLISSQLQGLGFSSQAEQFIELGKLLPLEKIKTSSSY